MLFFAIHRFAQKPNAIIYLEKAAKIGRAALTDPKLAGAISEADVVDYETRVKSYKSALK